MNSQPVEILLVEDNTSDVEMALHALKSHNVANVVHVATDGEQALQFLFGDGSRRETMTNRPRVVLLDIKLPKVDGLEVLRQIKQHEAARTIPVVVLTSSREDRDLTKAYELGANSYIVKPVNFDQFTTAVRDAGMYWLVLNEPLST